MIYFLFYSFLWANPLCQKGSVTATEYQSVKLSVEKHMAKAANLVTIATEADSVLSKLINAKSPVILNWMDKRKLGEAKEEVIAGEWRKYYLENFVLSQYPNKNPKINKSVEKLFKDIANDNIGNPDKLRLGKLLKKTKATATEVVASWKLEEKTHKEIIDRINDIDLYWLTDLESSPYKNKPLEFVKWGLAYDPTTNKINVGLDFKKHPNDMTIVSIMAHEIGHSIDSCRWSSFFKNASPFEKLNNCLRKNTGAKTRDDSQMKLAIEKKWLTQEMADSLKKNMTCNRSFYPPIGTQKEQILEVFADWFSAEVASRTELPFQEIRNDLCGKSELVSGSSYLSNQERLEKVYLAQPKIQKKLKFAAKASYCSI